ncbi:MAG: winged helix-turn-helix transcriptional regulator [Nitrospirae bacterium]|nr:winged helix-turn-helix transcriptional regulator [Nitrospirota bacterium]MBI3351045.1 winged helix-turn-helix transcriptional regulator [Nitrospirota bacterium]
MRPLQKNDVFHAISHPARRTILVLLKGGEKPASELVEPFGMSFAAISQHLKILKKAELVSEKRNGRQRIYRLHPKPLRNVSTWVDEFEAFWNSKLDALAEHLNRKHGKKKR